MKSELKKIWKFLWKDESIWSWLANIVIAFILIKFIVYPGLGFALQTDLPVVAVVSGSMEHKIVNECVKYDKNRLCVKRSNTVAEICGEKFAKQKRLSFDEYWNICGSWYEDQVNITKEMFANFRFKDGFNTGDVMILFRKSAQDVKVGDTIVFVSHDGIPIIHRVVLIQERNGEYFYTTKGDHNSNTITTFPQSEIDITYERYKGNAVGRIPLIGYVKILFVRFIYLFVP